MLLRAAFTAVLLAICASGPFSIRSAGAGRVPEPKDVFGFKPGDDYKLASHAQIVDLLPQARRRFRSHRRRGHRQERGRPADDPRVHLERSEHQESRALQGDRAAARDRARRRARPRRVRSRRKARRSSGSTADCTPPKWRTRSTRRSSRGGSSARRMTRRSGCAIRRSCC